MLTVQGRAASIACVLAGAVAVVSQSGCVTRNLETPALPWRPPRAVTFEEVVAAHDGYCRGLTTWSGRGDLDLRDLRSAKARRLGVRVLAGRGGRLYLKATVAVVTALEVVADGKRFWFRVPSKKTVWTGAAEAVVGDEASGEEAPYYALRPGDLVDAFLPPPLEPGPEKTWVLDGDRHTVALTGASSDGVSGVAQERVIFERESLRHLALLTYSGQGELLREVRYSDWRDGSPRRVLIARPQLGYEAEFVLDEVTTNRPLPERAFEERPADGYRVVEVSGP